MSTIKMFASVLLGITALFIAGGPAFLITAYKKREHLTAYLKDVAISLDELGGTLLYGEKDKTVSYMTGKNLHEGNSDVVLLAAFIDSIYGEGHCLNEYKSSQRID